MTTYPKRLIEVDLPIKRISAHARREKSIRHGHISTLHIWWARRPLAACRAVICASLWPDPADDHCPPGFRIVAADLMFRWAREAMGKHSIESHENFTVIRQHSSAYALANHPTTLRKALLDFIADFSNWDNSTDAEFLRVSRTLTSVAHYALGRDWPEETYDLQWPLEDFDGEVWRIVAAAEESPRPLVVDPFAGGGSIPLEALRIGADAFASDLNPIPVLLNKVVLEYIPKYGQRLADEVRKWGEWIKREAEKELAEFYPKDADGATPIAYLWARTIQCEGPGCGAEVPLIRTLWLAKKSNRSVALQLVPNKEAKRVDFKIIVKQRGGWVSQDDHKEKFEDPKFDGTLKRSSATCPCCGYTTSAERVRAQFKGRDGGSDSATLIAVARTSPSETGRQYRLSSKSDTQAFAAAIARLDEKRENHSDALSLIPQEELPYLRSIFNIQLLDVTQWGQLFSARQMLVMVTLVRLIREAGAHIGKSESGGVAEAVQTLLAFMLGKHADLANSLCAWEPVAECPRHLFGRQAIGIIWDFAEGVVTGESSGSWSIHVERMAQAIEALVSDWHSGDVAQASATKHPLANDSVQAVVTDPPYYDAVPYADLSDFFYVWLKRALTGLHGDLFKDELSPKREEAVQLAERNPKYAYKTKQHFESQMLLALSEARRVTQPEGLGVVVFAHKTTNAWETMLTAVIDAGWVVQASWPIDTECGSRLRAQDSAVLASSVHLVCRPRENPDGSVRTHAIGDWRDVLQELPRRIHEWMPRLAEEGVVGADAIFACLGPALEIFSRYSRVEKASGDAVTLKEYLEQVWAAVSREALSTIISNADLSGYEPDARLTAMWLWTLTGGKQDQPGEDNGNQEEEGDGDEDDEGSGNAKKQAVGFSLEYDAARKIAQGLGANLEELEKVVAVRGDQARLLSVGERGTYLFGKDQVEASTLTRGKKRGKQLDLFAASLDVGVAESITEAGGSVNPGATLLDRVHQSMILFGTGRGDALKRFLVDDGIGREASFWNLAQALSALYPTGTSEKRWVDGVLARKKGLGL